MTLHEFDGALDVCGDRDAAAYVVTVKYSATGNNTDTMSWNGAGGAGELALPEGASGGVCALAAVNATLEPRTRRYNCTGLPLGASSLLVKATDTTDNGANYAKAAANFTVAALNHNVSAHADQATKVVPAGGANATFSVLVQHGANLGAADIQVNTTGCAQASSDDKSNQITFECTLGFGAGGRAMAHAVDFYTDKKGARGGAGRAWVAGGGRASGCGVVRWAVPAAGTRRAR